jgi:hypothetical protein
VPHERVSQRGAELLVRLREAAHVDALLEEVRRKGGRVVALMPQRETLEDVFLSEIGGRSEAPSPARLPG